MMYLITLNVGMVGFFAILFGVVPLIFRASPSIQKFAVFLNYIQWPGSHILANPEKRGLVGTRNTYIKSHSNVTNTPLVLGVWHVLPSVYKYWSDFSESTDSSNGRGTTDNERTSALIKDEAFDALLAKGDRPIILYAHGNANNRGCDHRVQLYKILQELDYHVIAFDYRSYGDSTSIPLTEIGVVEDTIIVYNWILEKLGQTDRQDGKLKTPVFVWGHSLGTGIASHALAVLAGGELDTGIIAPKAEPQGLILESPFNNFHDELQGHILCKLYSWVPWFHWCIVEPVVRNGYRFESDRHIATYSAPVLILHAEDDNIVPYELGVKLYEAALLKRPKGFGAVEMITFGHKEELGHKYIYSAERLPNIIRNFVSDNSNDRGAAVCHKNDENHSNNLSDDYNVKKLLTST